MTDIKHVNNSNVGLYTDWICRFYKNSTQHTKVGFFKLWHDSIKIGDEPNLTRPLVYGLGESGKTAHNIYF